MNNTKKKMRAAAIALIAFFSLNMFPVSLKTKNQRQQSLFEACKENNGIAVQHLLLQGIDPCTPDQYGTPLLFRVIELRWSKSGILRDLLEYSIARHKDLSTITDAAGNTALHIAAQAANLNALEVIASCTDINPFAINKKNKTALELAGTQAALFDTTPITQLLTKIEYTAAAKPPVWGDEIHADEWLYYNFVREKAEAEKKPKNLD
jgi:ankyrin repeat protein